MRPRWRSCATSGRSSSIRCCSTARSRSCAARTARPARRGRRRRSHPRHVQPDRRPHRPAQQRPTEPAQHPGALRRRPPVPAVLHPRARLHVARRRLQPDRAALHRPSRRRPRPDRGVRERSGHPQRDGVAGVRRRPDRRHARSAIEGEDGLLRACLRHGVVRPRPATRHPHRGSGGHPRRLLRRLPEGAGVHGRHGQGGPDARVHRDVVRSSPADPGAEQLELPHPPGRRAAGDERRHPGPRRRHLQGRARPHRPGARGRAASRAA